MKIYFFIGKVTHAIVGLEPTTSPSIPLLWEEEVAIELAHWPIIMKIM